MSNMEEEKASPAVLHERRVAKIRRQLRNITKTDNFVNIFIERYPSYNNSKDLAKIRNCMHGRSRNSHILVLYEKILQEYPKEIREPQDKKAA